MIHTKEKKNSLTRAVSLKLSDWAVIRGSLIAKNYAMTLDEVIDQILSNAPLNPEGWQVFSNESIRLAAIENRIAVLSAEIDAISAGIVHRLIDKVRMFFRCDS
jgi:hypothetical protein